MSAQPTIPPVRKFHRGDRVLCYTYSGLFEVIGYTNNLPTSTVLIKDANFPGTILYDVHELSLTLINQPVESYSI